MDKKKYILEVPIEVKSYDIDVAQHVNNIVYIRWMEDLRLKWLKNFLPFDQLMSENIFPILRSTNIEFKREIKIFDKPIGKIWIADLRRSIFTINFEFINNGKIAAFGTQRGVLYNTKTKRIIDPLEKLNSPKNKKELKS